jgi:hypothetical protein
MLALRVNARTTPSGQIPEAYAADLKVGATIKKNRVAANPISSIAQVDSSGTTATENPSGRVASTQRYCANYKA